MMSSGAMSVSTITGVAPRAGAAAPPHAAITSQRAAGQRPREHATRQPPDPEHRRLLSYIQDAGGAAATGRDEGPG
jgi:hypothetical protein